MRHSIVGSIMCVVLGIVLVGCAPIHGKTDLAEVARRAELSNVTTGDGTFEDYTATGHHSATEIGIGVGIPFLVKLFEIYPAATNEDLLTDAAREAKAGGADAMINVTPNKTLYTGIPFFIVGIYVDSNEGTGIRSR